MKVNDTVVAVAAEAIRSGDPEAIADAQVGLAALGVNDHSIHEQLALAAAMLEPKAALARSSEGGFIELLAEAWKRKQFGTVAFGFSQLRLGATEADVEAISAAIAKVNGKRRTELLSIAELISVAIEVRNGAISARRPPDAREWRKRDALRSFCSLTKREDGSALLEVGTETVESYSAARRASTDLSLSLKAVEPQPAPATATPKLGMTSALPQAVREPLERVLSWREPSIDAFHGVMDVLTQVTGDERQPAIEFVARHVSLWPDGTRGTRWNFDPLRITPELQPLFRALSCGLGALCTHAETWPSDAPLFSGLTDLGVTEFSAPESGLTVLERFPKVERLGLKLDALAGNPTFIATAQQMRLPRALRTLELDSAWNEEGLSSLVTRINAQCPKFESVTVRRGKLAPLDALSPSVQIALESLGHPGDLKSLATLGATRTFAKLDVSFIAETPTELAPYSARTRALTLRASPGQLDLVLRQGDWSQLTALTVHLPARWARMHRKKPPDYTFTKGDLETLTKAPFFSKLTSLKLTGILEDGNSELLCDALVSSRPPLTRLALNASECGNEFLEKALTAGVLERVTELELHRCKLKAKGFALFTEPGAPQALRKLVLSKNAATQLALERFAGWSGLSSVKRLDLREMTLTPEQRSLLQNAPHLRREALDLSDADFW
ncbi:MAG: hypothetical protein JNM17_12345 [Archangium sp.]|nr:hypothetical protein [Archangium sp.]